MIGDGIEREEPGGIVIIEARGNCLHRLTPVGGLLVFMGKCTKKRMFYIYIFQLKLHFYVTINSMSRKLNS